LDGDDLVFEWPPDMVHDAELWLPYLEPSRLTWDAWREARRIFMTSGLDNIDVSRSRAMLLRFAQLRDARPELVRRFASSYGALQEWFNVEDPTVPPLLPQRQSLGFWRSMSRSFAEVLDLAARSPREDLVHESIALRVNRHLSDSGVTVYLEVDERHRFRVYQASGGLYGGLAIELLSTVARVGLRLCRSCGGEVEPGGRIYCSSCRGRGVPEMLRQRRKREPNASGSTPTKEPAASQGDSHRG
jgi:hypothetical protein